jgi:alpha-1,2-mannosyltransferase
VPAASDPRPAAAGRLRALEVGLVLVVGTVWIAWRLRNLGMPIDLAVYRTGGRHVLDGTDLYVLRSGSPVIEAFGRSYELHSPFTYPPFAGLVFLPLALLPAAAVAVGWLFASLAALAQVIRTSFAPFLAGAQVWWGSLLPVALVFTAPVTDALFFGQIDLFVLLLLLVDCTRTDRRRGIATGVATALKLSPGLFVIFFLLTRQWGAARRAVVTFVALTVLAWILLPSASWRYWTDPASAVERVGGPASYANQSLHGAQLRLGLPGWFLPVAVAIVAVAGLAIARRLHDRGAALAAASAVGLVTLLISPVSWIHHAVWIVPIVAVVLGSGARPWRRWTALVAALVFTLRLPLFGSLVLEGSGPRVVGHVLEEAYVVAYLVLLVLLAGLFRTRETSPLYFADARSGGGSTPNGP